MQVALIAALVIIGVVAARADDAFKSLAQGVEYRHDVRAAGPLSIHVLRIDRHQKWDLQTGLGQGTVYGLEPFAGIVARVAALLKKPAVAAINGDFFVIKPGPYQGDPQRPANCPGRIGQQADGKLVLGHAQRRIEDRACGIEAEGHLARWKKRTPLGLNEARADDEITLYTPTLGLRPNESPKEPPTTRTKGGKELVLERIEGQPWLPLQAGRTYSARVAEVRDGGNSPLQADKMILSIGPKLMFPAAKVGNVMQLAMETKPDLEGVKTALGAGRVLVQAARCPILAPTISHATHGR